MALRVDHRGVDLPPPTPPILWKMAKAGYDTLGGLRDSAKVIPLGWDDSSQHWYVVARSMYGALVAAAGAKVTKIEEPEDA